MSELVIKRALERSDFNVQPAVLRRALLDGGWQELAIAAHHVLAVANLPPLHRDPFDRLLLAQASADGLLLITSDRQLTAYPGPIRLMDAKDKQGVEASWQEWNSTEDEEAFADL